MPEHTKKRPVHEVRIGSVKAAIWRNEGSTNPWHSVTFERIYKDGEEWKSSASFGKDELLLLAKISDRAHTWIFENEGRADSQ